MRLNIIGNGFDLYHGLPCSYYYFGCFLAKYYPDFYEEMAQMYNFSCYRGIGYEEVETVVDDFFGIPLRKNSENWIRPGWKKALKMI